MSPVPVITATLRHLLSLHNITEPPTDINLGNRVHSGAHPFRWLFTFTLGTNLKRTSGNDPSSRGFFAVTFSPESFGSLVSPRLPSRMGQPQSLSWCWNLPMIWICHLYNLELRLRPPLCHGEYQTFI